eukprot:gb/GFBE01049531.1/.p1 GENE.gb/GFBE01049531.1/~~gb/GFBE01049531.1/.p1  ORF type:complete len:696 (+),score=118.26 gb/GFBE01049531.1/:1-2088(+)
MKFRFNQQLTPVICGALVGLLAVVKLSPRAARDELLTSSSEAEESINAAKEALFSQPLPQPRLPSQDRSVDNSANVGRRVQPQGESSRSLSQSAQQLRRPPPVSQSGSAGAATAPGTHDTVSVSEGSPMLQAAGSQSQEQSVRDPAQEAEEALQDEKCVKKHEGRSGGELESPSKEKTYKACRKRCLCLDGCHYWTYWTDGNCHVFDNRATSFPALDATSGPASCNKRARKEDLVIPPDIPRAAPAPSIQATMPKVYVYELPDKFRNYGRTPDCKSVDCVFGGPPESVLGVDIWSSNQFHMPLLLHWRFENSPRRTLDIDEADVFVVPAYNFKLEKETPCATPEEVKKALIELNPRLKNRQWAKAKASRHLLMDARGWETCNYMWEFSWPFRLFHRINIELNGMLADGPEGWTDNKPWFWYQFPYPSVYHGPVESAPAKMRPRGPARYLWCFSGTGRGQAGYLRQMIMLECNKCNRCAKETSIAEVNGRIGEEVGRDSKGLSDYARLAKLKMQSTFCIEPPGDTITRKSLIDSMNLGCIPVIFEHQELDMFEPFFTAEEFAAAVVYIPEVQLIGENGPLSLWAKGPGTKHRTLEKRLRTLYPAQGAIFDAVKHPEESGREEELRKVHPKRSKLVDILKTFSPEEIKKKQEALAEIGPRLVVSLDDSGRDAVRILLDTIVSNDEAAREREAKSTLK